MGSIRKAAFAPVLWVWHVCGLVCQALHALDGAAATAVDNPLDRLCAWHWAKLVAALPCECLRRLPRFGHDLLLMRHFSGKDFNFRSCLLLAARLAALNCFLEARMDLYQSLELLLEFLDVAADQLLGGVGLSSICCDQSFSVQPAEPFAVVL